jgi:hypothetical protein
LRKFIFIAILVAAVVLVTLGCISLPEKKPAEKITTLKIGYQPSTHHIAEMVAAEKGWWQRDLKPLGITEIKEFVFQTGPPEMQSLPFWPASWTPYSCPSRLQPSSSCTSSLLIPLSYLPEVQNINMTSI